MENDHGKTIKIENRQNIEIKQKKKHILSNKKNITTKLLFKIKAIKKKLIKTIYKVNKHKNLNKKKLK